MKEYSPRSTAWGPSSICFTTASMVGRTSHSSEVTTCSGASSSWSTIIPIAGMSASSAAAMTPSRSAYRTSAPAATWALAACLAAAGSKKELMKETFTVAWGFSSCDTLDEAVDDAVDLGDRHRADHADGVGLGQPAGEHAGEVRRVLHPVVEDAEVGLLRPLTRSERERDVGVVLGHRAYGVLRSERVADDRFRLLVLGDVTQRPLHLVARGEVVDVFVGDLAIVRGRGERRVDGAVPRLLQRSREHAVHQWGIGVAAGRVLIAGRAAAGGQCRAGDGEQEGQGELSGGNRAHRTTSTNSSAAGHPTPIGPSAARGKSSIPNACDRTDRAPCWRHVAHGVRPAGHAGAGRRQAGGGGRFGAGVPADPVGAHLRDLRDRAAAQGWRGAVDDRARAGRLLTEGAGRLRPRAGGEGRGGVGHGAGPHVHGASGVDGGGRRARPGSHWWCCTG